MWFRPKYVQELRDQKFSETFELENFLTSVILSNKENPKIAFFGDSSQIELASIRISTLLNGIEWYSTTKISETKRQWLFHNIQILLYRLDKLLCGESFDYIFLLNKKFEDLEIFTRAELRASLNFKNKEAYRSATPPNIYCIEEIN